jgi:hypothetical protein
MPKSKEIRNVAIDWIAYWRRFLANCRMPRCVEFSESEPPKSGFGTVLKRNLRERYWAHQERPVS